MKRSNEWTVTVVNLADGSVETLKSSPETAGRIGGAAVNTCLLEKYRDQFPLVLGTGPLTGGFAPGSCLMIASFIKQGRGPCHVPVVIRSGPLLKFSGTDYLILLGRAPGSVLVSVEKGRVALKPDPFPDKRNFFRIVEECRSAYYEEPVLIAAPESSPDDDIHGAGTSAFGGFDRCGLSGIMASKNIRAIIPCGGGGLPYDKADLTSCIRLTEKTKKHLPRNRSMTVLNALSDAGTAKSLIKKHLKQSHACFHCPVACISYLSIKRGREWLGKEAPEGVFVTDYEGFSHLARKHPAHAHLFMARAQALGINPRAVAAGIPENGSPDRLLAEIKNVPIDAPYKNRGTLFEASANPEWYYRFGNALPPPPKNEKKGPLESWEERVAFAMITGVCPVPLIVIPDLSPLDYLPFLTQDKNDEKMFLTELERDIQMMLTFNASA